MPSLNDLSFSGESFDNFFKENFKNACSYCQLKYGFDLDTSKEIVHMAFVRLWQNRENIKPDQSVQGYLYKTLANSTRDYFKHELVKQKHREYVLKNYSESDEGKSIVDPDFKKLTNDINSAVSDLPEMMRKIFVLNRYEGLKYSQIAARLGISIKTVETQMSRALVKLRQKLSRYLHIGILFIIMEL